MAITSNFPTGDTGYIPSEEKGAASGVATLDSSGKVPSSQLPSYVDDVLEYSSSSSFPATGETGKIYVATDTNKTYRWGGSAYVEISASLALGETSSTAYRGDRGKTAYDHSQDSTVHITSAERTAWNGKWTAQNGTTSQKGIVQLSSSTSSTSTTLAATASAVKSAYDLANTANTTANGKLSASNIKSGVGIVVQTSGNDVTVTLESAVVPIPGISTTLNDNTWAQISQVSAQLQGANYWAVGDRKAVALSGTASKLSLNATYYVYIIGFNHNSSVEGNGITFGGFVTALSGGVQIALESGYSDDSDFRMNTSNTNSGGWKKSDMRYNILGSTKTSNADASTDTATSPKSATLMSCLPSDLRAVMKPMTIYTDNTGGGSDTASYVTATVDYLPLLAEFEVFGRRSYANSAEKNYQAQYAYYSSGNSKIKYKHSSTGSAVGWWERSPSSSGSSTFCTVSSGGGGASCYDASYSLGVAPAFRI